MNEKIKELADQADEYAEQTVPYYNRQAIKPTIENKIRELRYEKFAELIVKECLSDFKERIKFARKHKSEVIQGIAFGMEYVYNHIVDTFGNNPKGWR